MKRITLPLFALLLSWAGAAPTLAAPTLVAAGSSWKYLDDGSDQGTAWKEPAFADTQWKVGQAELGYGDTDEATLVEFGGDANNRHITTYFRKSFTVTDPSAFSGLNLRLLRDDGAVVYLNGIEVRRDNLPAGAITHTTLASSALGEPQEETFVDTVLPTTGLVAGTNTLAVEVHQANVTSTDLSFNLELIGQTNQTLVPAGSVWKYLDNGSNQGTAWRQPSFADGTWLQGAAELGYGDADEATAVGFGGNTTNRYITTYFRKSFTIADPNAFLSLNLRLLRDDGAVVYLNGTEVRRDNLPAGTITHTTLASSALGEPQEETFYDSVLPTTSLVAGTNTLAVEVHQANATSSDLSFNLELVGLNSTSITRGPYLQLATPTSMIVRWRTDVATVGRVALGTSVEALTTTVDEPAATTEHQVSLTGLLPATRYYYSIGTPSTTLDSGSEFTFLTPPVPGTVQPTRVWVLGDSGTADANAAAVANAYAGFTQNTPTDVWLMLGDNAYNNGTDTEYQAAVYNMYPAFLRQNVLWSTIGNHDTASSTNPALTIPYFQMFNLPTAGEAGGVASGTEKYYSFDHANIHFICLDSMTSNRSSNSTMATWLDEDLRSTTQEWIIAFWHHPPYSKGSHDSDTEAAMVEMRTQLLPLLEAGGVDLVLAGHSHSYERSHLLNGHYGVSGTLTPAMILDAGGGQETGAGAYEKAGQNAANQGAVYITAGSSGKISGGSLNHPAMFVSLNNLGSMVLDVSGPRLDAKFLRENGVVADSFTLLKSVPNLPPTVRIDSPTNNATFTTGQVITIAATAEDPDAEGFIRQVDFYLGETALGSDTTAPYAFDWTAATAGTYALTATATDRLGATVTSAPVTIVVADAPPPPPDAPTGLTATAGNQNVSLTWTASTGAATYTVYRATMIDGIVGIYVPAASGITSTSHLDAGLTNGTTYFYMVTGTNTTGVESEASAVTSATPVLPAPEPPTGLAATAGDAQVELSWTASSGATSYTIERATISGGPYATLASESTSTGYLDTDVTNDTTYFYVVTAVNEAGSSARSAEVVATPMAPPTPPAAPADLTATAGDSQVSLTWTASDGATSYTVLRSSLSGGGYTVIASDLGTTTHVDTTAANGTTYYYVVTATNAGGTSGLSNESAATPLPPVPAPPTGLTATAGDAQVSLSWTASAGATNYTVLRSTQSGGGYAAIASDLGTTTHVDTTAANGTTYYYVVTATNAGGTSGNSNLASARPVAPPAPPSSPSNLTATAASKSRINLKWADNSNNETGFKIERKQGTGAWTQIAVTKANTTSYASTGLTANTVYTYRVLAAGAAGDSAYSNEATATTPRR